MYELSLFSGAGLGCCGTRWLLGWRCVGYAECVPYRREVLRARIRDGLLDDAPIFADVREIKGAVAARYRELARRADLCITAGFPCQPFSVAGKRRGEDDERNGWPELARIIREVRPEYALLENVSGLLVHEYVRRVFGDLAEMGYDCRWGVISAADVGANHLRKRLWIVAHAMRQRRKGGETETDAQLSMSSALRTNVADAISTRLEVQQRQPRDDEKERSPIERACDARAWWQAEPDVGRVVDGCAARVDRLAALGDGQVSAVVRAAWMLLRVGFR